jgi:hypothetical protein
LKSDKSQLATSQLATSQLTTVGVQPTMDLLDPACLDQERAVVRGAKRQLRAWMEERLAPLAEAAPAMKEELEQTCKGVFMQAANALAANAREGRPFAQVVVPLHHPGFTTLVGAFAGSMRLAALGKLVGKAFVEPYSTSAFHADVETEVALVSLLSGGAGFLLCAFYPVEGVHIHPNEYFDETLGALGVNNQNG